MAPFSKVEVCTALDLDSHPGTAGAGPGTGLHPGPSCHRVWLWSVRPSSPSRRLSRRTTACTSPHPVVNLAGPHTQLLLLSAWCLLSHEASVSACVHLLSAKQTTRGHRGPTCHATQVPRGAVSCPSGVGDCVLSLMWHFKSETDDRKSSQPEPWSHQEVFFQEEDLVYFLNPGCWAAGLGLATCRAPFLP